MADREKKQKKEKKHADYTVDYEAYKVNRPEKKKAKHNYNHLVTTNMSPEAIKQYFAQKFTKPKKAKKD